MHRIELPAWAIERHHANRFAQIDPLRTALVVVDMQNAFTRAGEVFANPHACDIVPLVNELAAVVRGAAGGVFWTRQTIVRTGPLAYPAWQFDESQPFVKAAMESLSAGAEGHALHQALDVRPGDEVVDKHRYSAFIGQASDLDARLKARGADTLIIAGTLTNVCCESTARDAQMLGYKVLFAADATAAATDDEHNAALLNLGLHFADVRVTRSLIELILASGRW